MRAVRCVVVLGAVLAVSGPGGAQPLGETVWIPFTAADGSRLKLEGTLYRGPQGVEGPLVLFTHGSSGGPIPSGYTERAEPLAATLLPEGATVLAVMRPGRGRSQGSDPEQPSDCTVEAAQDGIAHGLSALEASWRFARESDWGRDKRLVVAGHSRGGVLAVAFARRHPQAVAAVLNFSGGWKDDRCGDGDINRRLFALHGAAGEVPQLYLYARGDGFYADASMQAYGDDARRAGGKVTMQLYPPQAFNGHLLFRRGVASWGPDVLAFLKAAGVGQAGSALPLPGRAAVAADLAAHVGLEGAAAPVVDRSQ